MSKQKFYQHKSRWKRFKQMNKRRVNAFLLEQKVRELKRVSETQAEDLIILNECADDMWTELERKVEFLILENQKMHRAMNAVMRERFSLGRWVRSWFGRKMGSMG